jgi:hypothetical protein
MYDRPLIWSWVRISVVLNWSPEFVEYTYRISTTVYSLCQDHFMSWLQTTHVPRTKTLSSNFQKGNKKRKLAEVNHSPGIHAGVSCPRACMGNMTGSLVHHFPHLEMKMTCMVWSREYACHRPPGQTWAKVSVWCNWWAHKTKMNHRCNHSHKQPLNQDHNSHKNGQLARVWGLPFMHSMPCPFQFTGTSLPVLVKLMM